MATPVWQPGTIYAPGSLVQSASAIAPVPDQVTNGGFESGNTGWSLGSGFSIGEFGNGTHFQGTWSLQWDLTGSGRAINTNATEVVPGQTINANCQVQQGASSSGEAGARAEIAWYDASDELISFSSGNLIDSGSNQTWKQSSVTGVAPAGAAFARFSVYAERSGGGDELWVDNCTWDAVVTTLPTGLVFRAVQALAGYSGATEPVWPIVNGATVVDNEVTWEAVFASRVVWEAAPVLVSGSYEPDWPTIPDGTVADGTIKWVAMNARVQDAKCPHSKIVAIAVSKIFAADEDIIPFSATTNPLDWSSEADAGYLPFGLNTYGATPVGGLGLYRGNLIAFNSEGYQMWQVDQDPANMALLDASPVDCVYRKSVQAVMNDLVFLSSQGVRNISIAGGSTNLQAGSFGKQIDPLVLAKLQAGLEPISLFFPGFGQYWLIFDDEAFVLTINSSKDQSWSRYVFPAAITDFAIQSGVLYLRAGDLVWEVSLEALADDVYFDVPTIEGLTIPEDPGTLLVWPNAVLFRRTQGSVGVAQTPNGYSSSGGSVTIPGDNGGYAVVSSAGTTGAFAAFTVTVGGFDMDDNPVTEQIVKTAGLRFVVGEQLFSIITSVTLDSTATGTDAFYCVGYQTWTPDEDGDDIIIDMRGAIVIQGNASGASIAANGLLDTAYPITLPSSGLLTVQRSANTAAITLSFNGGTETIALPTGVTGQIVTGDTDVASVSAVAVTQSGSTFVDIGIYLTISPSSEPFEGYIAWPYLDFGVPGMDKTLDSVDVTADGTFTVSIGYNQRNFDLATTPHPVDGDTLPGTPVPIPVAGPSFQLRLTFDSQQEWEWQMANMYLSAGGGP